MRSFLKDLENWNLPVNSDNRHENYTNLSKTFSKVVHKHVPLKKKILRGSNETFINIEFRKEIYNQSHLRKKTLERSICENELLFKTQRNKCVSLWKLCNKSYFQDISTFLFTNKSFWNFVEHFLTNKSCHTQNYIMLIDNGKAIVEESDLVETCSDR